MDYGLALKSDNGKLLFQRLFFLLRLNMALVQKNAYSRSIMMQLLNMLYQRHHNLPPWQMFMRSTAVFNEEVGELILYFVSNCPGRYYQVLVLTHEQIVRSRQRLPRQHRRYDQ